MLLASASLPLLVLLGAATSERPPNPDQVSAFFKAIAADDLATVDSMLRQSAGLARAEDGQGNSALVSAAFILVKGEGFHSIAENKVLKRIQSAAPPATLFEACLVGDLDRARESLRHDRDAATRRGPFGWQPIHAAAFSGNTVLIARLLAAGAEVDAVANNRFKNTALQTALLGKQTEAARFLVLAGADVRHRQAEGNTALHDAAMMGDAGLVDFLLAHGADLNARTDDGDTALSLARKRGHADVARRLEAAGAGG